MNRITVTKNKSRLGSYDITTLRNGSKIPYTESAQGADGAAAKALEKAIGCSGQYQILGDTEVLNVIRNGGVIGYA